MSGESSYGIKLTIKMFQVKSTRKIKIVHLKESENYLSYYYRFSHFENQFGNKN